ncbi:hypothetical protein DKG79_09845 [Escherichia fergusonii]|nr:hypothetical protein DKG79_09845 [Escherichia fergusonii]
MTSKKLTLRSNHSRIWLTGLLLFRLLNHLLLFWRLKWFTEFGHLNRGDMLTSEQHRCHNEKKKFQRRV